ncbi:MAG: hypothetical protein A2978_06985, partial [Chlamydiae bacterium RIFCSPLOWO2_01_FULL_44_52]
DSQRQLCSQFAGASRFLYNRGLAQRKQVYEETGKSVSYFEQNNDLVPLKKQQPTAWLKDIHSQVLQQALKNLDAAFQNFFQNLKKGKKPGFPRFKCKGIRDSFRYPQGVHIENSQVYLPKIGYVLFRKSREIEGTLKQTTILREGSHWYVSFSCEIEINDPVPAPIAEEKAIGIDMGLKSFAVMASGPNNTAKRIDNPRFFTQDLPRLRVLSRRLCKKVKGSKNWLRAKLQLSKLHARIRHCREDFAHKLSTEIIKSHDIICVESLDIPNLLQTGTRSLSRAIADASWRFFLGCLKYKAKEKGKHFVETGQYFPSTQTCNSCWHRQKMELGDRIYRCIVA